MNIIQAFQAAECGELITNNVMKINNRFLRYTQNGVFFEYELVQNKPVYKFEVRRFSTSDILSIGWEILETNYFKHQ